MERHLRDKRSHPETLQTHSKGRFRAPDCEKARAARCALDHELQQQQPANPSALRKNEEASVKFTVQKHKLTKHWDQSQHVSPTAASTEHHLAHLSAGEVRCTFQENEGCSLGSQRLPKTVFFWRLPKPPVFEGSDEKEPGLKTIQHSLLECAEGDQRPPHGCHGA